MYDKQISTVETLLQNIDTLSDAETKRKVNIHLNLYLQPLNSKKSLF